MIIFILTKVKFVQVLLVYVLELLLLICLMLLLHWFSPKIGLLPVLFVMMTLNALIALSPLINTSIMLPSNLVLFVVGHIFIPIVFLSFLLIYILHGQAIAQITLLSFIVVNILITTVMIVNIYVAHINADAIQITSSLTVFEFSNADFLRNSIASILGFSLAMVFSVVVYQGIHNRYPNMPYIMTIFIAMTVALWVDSIAYVAVGTLEMDIFWGNLRNDFIVKTFISILVIIPTFIYFEALVKFGRLESSYGRPMLGILFGSQEQLKSGLVEMQSELHFSQQLYDHLTENLDEIIYIIDIDSTKLIYVSPAFEVITGFESDLLNEEMDNLQLIIHPDDRVKPPLLDFMLYSNPLTFRFIHKNGQIGWMSNRILPIQNKEGEVYRYVGIATNITHSYERQKRELELEISQERVRVLQNFVRDASHDLKTPLNSILLKINMLKYASPDRQKSLQLELKDRALYISKMIDDLFTLSLIEGNTQIDDIPIDLQMIAQVVLADLDALAQTKSLTMTIVNTDAECTVISTQEAMTRVFANLISNAIRYSEKGQITVTFSANHKTVSFSVSDTGIGIPEDNLANIFDRFFRSDNAREFATDGTGLGLAIIQAIIEKHKGTISVTSRLNHGTTFHVSLPRQR